MNGAILINKSEGISSFGVIEHLQDQLKSKKNLHHRDLPKIGHGGTLDPFATGLLVVLIGKGVKLARYFLGATKHYQGVIKFGETTVPGDPTSPISETSTVIPQSFDELQDLAHRMTLQPYLQIPPMHSAKKKNGRPLYELARAGIEIDREPKLCHLYEFRLNEYQPPKAQFELKCSSGTYVRTLSQDLGRLCNSVAMLENLHRTKSGSFSSKNAWTLDEVIQSEVDWNQLPCWIPFDRLLDGYARAEANPNERDALLQGKQNDLLNILKRAQSPIQKSGENHQDCLTIYCENSLIAIARNVKEQWELERVFN